MKLNKYNKHITRRKKRIRNVRHIPKKLPSILNLTNRFKEVLVFDMDMGTAQW